MSKPCRNSTAASVAPGGASPGLNRFLTRILAVAACAWFLIPGRAQAQSSLVSDDFNVLGAGTGFGLNTGVNTGINPPATRLTGSQSGSLRYMLTTTRSAASFSITGQKLRVSPAADAGRFTLSANGTTPFDFGPALGIADATRTNPVVYDLAIKMANSSPGAQRFSFAIGTAEGDANSWAFGIQLYRNGPNDSFYTIGKRVDSAACGLASDLNIFITNTPPDSVGTEVSFLLRVTDVGSESASFGSRVQLSTDGGFTWIYDTATDPDLPLGWRFNGPGRFIIWDVAPNAGDVTYDDFSLSPMPLSVLLLSPAADNPRVGRSPVLQTYVSHAKDEDMTVTFYGREAPKPYPGPDFCIAVLPDTQNYAREVSGHGEAVKEMWFAQTDWIVSNRIPHNIVYVAHLGDIVQNGDIKVGNPNFAEWRNATNAMYRLENPAKTLLREGIPYGMAVGNHDQEPMGDPDGETAFYNSGFGIPHFAGRQYYGGNFASNNDSHYDLFSVGGLDFIVFYFEYGRHGSGVMNWANNVLATNQHRRVIAVTHWAGSDSTPSNLSPHGEDILNGLKQQTNFFMMLGGHVADGGGEGSRVDYYQGRPIRTFISDFQGWMNGGDGYMRLMYFSPSNNTVTIKTYSPWLNQFKTDANSQMSFAYKMQTNAGSPGSPYVTIATNLDVASGTASTATWRSLQLNKTYDWYVKVTDSQGNTVTSPERRFTVANNAPFSSNQLFTVVGDEPVSRLLPAFDPDGDPLTFELRSVPANGLISGFTPDSGEFIYTAARGFRGLDQITYSVNDGSISSPVGTISFNVQPPADTNANGIADAWEQRYAVGLSTADDDGDGLDNLAEYRANTNPTNAASKLQITGTTWNSGGLLEVSWDSIGGVRYRIQYSEDPTLSSFIDFVRPLASEMDPAPVGTPSTQSFLDPFSQKGGGPQPGRFYRVKVLP